MESTCNIPNSKEDLEVMLLQEKLEALQMINEEYQKYLDALERENNIKKAYIHNINNENTQ